mgnify:CR=1 FL=1
MLLGAAIHDYVAVLDMGKILQRTAPIIHGIPQ